MVTRTDKTLTIMVLIAIPVFFFLYFAGKSNFVFPWSPHVDSSVVVIFNDKTPLRVTVVKSIPDLMRGLSGVTSLPATEGMLFVFPNEGYHGIWMKDMLFPIDITWIDAQGEIISIEQNVHPDSYPHSFEPPRPDLYVIETNSYFMSSFNIKVGDKVRIPGYIEHKALQN